MVDYTKELNNELVLEVEPDKGIETGYVSGKSYTDSNGNSRNKYETLKTLSSTTIKKLKAEAVEPDPIPEEETPPV